MHDKYRSYLKVIFTVGLLCLDYIEMSTFSDQQRLRAYLSQCMDTSIRPVLNQSHAVQVDLVPVLIALHGLDEKAQVLSSTTGMRLSWRYETLTWNSSEFGDAQTIEVSSDRIWTPDITYHNAFRETIEISKRASSKVTIAENGVADWHTGANLETGCNVDITKYPFDTQTCKIVFGKMIYYDYQQMVTSVEDKVVTPAADQNNEWHIADTNIRYIKLHDHVTYIELLIVLERRYLFYVLNFITPVIMLSMMNVLSFKLPSTSGERIGYSISLLLTYVVLLNMISDSVPKVSKSVSYLQLYIIIQFALAIIISILSIMLVRMADSKYDTKIPKFVYSMYKTFERYAICKRECVQAKVNPHDKDKDTKKERCATGHDLHLDVDAVGALNVDLLNETPNMENINVAQFLDHLCFWVFMCLFVISTVTCLISMTL